MVRCEDNVNQALHCLPQQQVSAQKSMCAPIGNENGVVVAKGHSHIVLDRAPKVLFTGKMFTT